MSLDKKKPAMIISVSKNRSFLRHTLYSTRGMLKGQNRQIKQKPEIQVLLQQLRRGKPVQQAEKKLKAEVVVNATAPVTKSRRFDWRKALFLFFTISSLVLLTGLFGPTVYYKIFPGDPVPVTTTETGTPLGGRFDEGTQQRTVPLPAYDESLPEGEWIRIPRIGLNGQIQESDNSEVALEKGVWRVPDFGTAGDLTKPMILASHRYGYIWWWKNGSQYWRYNSFNLLPETEPGDFVEVISGKRKYVYEIYAGEENTEITDYNADLILYTCKFLNGDARFFRYARLVDPTKDTQKSASSSAKAS